MPKERLINNLYDRIKISLEKKQKAKLTQKVIATCLACLTI